LQSAVIGLYSYKPSNTRTGSIQMEEKRDVVRQNERRARGDGCSTAIGQGIVGFLILIVTLVIQFATFSAEQTIFEDPQAIADIRWMLALGYSVFIILLTAVIVILSRGSSSRPVYRSWMLAAIYSLLIVPARLAWLTDAEWIGGLQIAGQLIFILGLAIWLGRTLGASKFHRLPLAFFCGVILILPWALWGALGSPLDVVINLLVALLLGISASMILLGSLLANRTPAENHRERIWGTGWAFALVLIIMATGLGMNGQQWMLAGVLPVIAWAAVIFCAFEHEPGSSDGHWPSSAVLLGLAATGPLLWIDPDELALVISGGQGDLVAWAVRMTFITLILGVLVNLFVYLSRRIIADRSRIRILGGGLALVGLIGAGLVYFGLGHPGFYGEHLFVVLKDQADVSAAVQMPDYNQRRAYVYQTLVKKADTSQKNIRSMLDRLGIRYKPYYLVNGLQVWADAPVRLWLESQPEVDRVLSNPELRPLPQPLPVSRGDATLGALPQWDQTLIGADRVWKDFKVTGQGVIVGQSDSGAQGDHPELADSYRGKNGQNDYNWYDPWFGSQKPVDIGGHGTHTLGSMVGKNVGVAPGAAWIGCVNLARNLGNPAYYLDCMQFMLAPFPQKGDPLRDGDPSRGAMVLNNSWGCPKVEGCDPNALLPAVNALRSAGIFVVVAAGNSGYDGCGSVTDPPAIYSSVFSVGAVDNQGQRADFSSLGPVKVDGSNRIKPDIAAPGVNVLSAYPQNTYQTASGTSMASPHVVGVVALMWSANPKLIGNVDLTKEILDQTAQPYRGQLPACVNGQSKPNDAVGYGLINAYAAVKAAMDAR
jgi:subtilisin family serine protease